MGGSGTGGSKSSGSVHEISIRQGRGQLIDAVLTVGQYNLVSWALNSFGVPLDDFLPGARP